MDESKENLALSNSLDNNEVIVSNSDDDTEDFIQPSQPLSFQTPSLESTSRNISTENETSGVGETEISPFVSSPLANTSNDFIPSSELQIKTKSGSIETILDNNCKKKLNLDMFPTQSNLDDTIDATHLKVHETQSILGFPVMVPESPPHINETLDSQVNDTMFSDGARLRVLEETPTEDSVIVKSPEFAEGNSSNNHRSDNTKEKIVDSSVDIKVAEASPFFDTSGIFRLRKEQETEKEPSEEVVALDETIDVNEIVVYKSGLREKTDTEAVEELISPLQSESQTRSTDRENIKEGSMLKAVLKNVSAEELAGLQKHSTPENPLSKSLKINESTSSIENGTPPVQENLSEFSLTMFLQVNCQIMVDPLTNQSVSKKILNVKEFSKKQQKPIFHEPVSDSSYKVKRLSSSSSGSVYSDKTGLPYPLPNLSTMPSAQREVSSGSSVDLVRQMHISDRQQWVNEFMLPMAMDEILPRFIEQRERNMNVVSGLSAKKKMSMKAKKKSHWKKPLDDVLESSLTEPSSENCSDINIQNEIESSTKNYDNDKFIGVDGSLGNANGSQMKELEEKSADIKTEDITKDKDNEELESTELLMEGLQVFARWTDKRYYPGKLKNTAKYDRWEVEFDDDTTKVVREDLILPLKWMLKGELVFALLEEKYMSGKISEIIRDEEEIKYKIELDDTNELVVVKKSDLCLNDVMAGIIREKYKPRNNSCSVAKSSDIDFDNVVTGKRVREQRTPARCSSAKVLPGSSTLKKRESKTKVVEESEDMSKRAIGNVTPLGKHDLSTNRYRSSSKKKIINSDVIEEENDGVKVQATSTSRPSSSSSATKSGLRKRYHDPNEGDGSHSSKKSRFSDELSNDGLPNQRGQRKTKGPAKKLMKEFENITKESVKEQQMKKRSERKNTKNSLNIVKTQNEQLSKTDGKKKMIKNVRDSHAGLLSRQRRKESPRKARPGAEKGRMNSR